MCPFCISGMALAVGGATSAGAVAAFAGRRLNAAIRHRGAIAESDSTESHTEENRS
jgi:fructose-1,6-bisphosphatase/inositol monophosphatase family enzyme